MLRPHPVSYGNVFTNTPFKILFIGKPWCQYYQVIGTPAASIVSKKRVQSWTWIKSGWVAAPACFQYENHPHTCPGKRHMSDWNTALLNLWKLFIAQLIFSTLTTNSIFSNVWGCITSKVVYTHSLLGKRESASGLAGLWTPRKILSKSPSTF